jgi:hypothetical protein
VQVFIYRVVKSGHRIFMWHAESHVISQNQPSV